MKDNNNKISKAVPLLFKWQEKKKKTKQQRSKVTLFIHGGKMKSHEAFQWAWAFTAVHFGMWAFMPCDESLTEGHVAALLLLEFLFHRSPGATAWPTQTAEGPAGDPRKGGNPLCPLSGDSSKACLNITTLKITHNLFFIQSNCASLFYLCQQGNSASRLQEQWWMLI